MSLFQRTWRVIAGVASLVILFRMADAVDTGATRDWSFNARAAWVAAMVALLFFGVGTLAQFAQTLLGETPVRWFPEKPARARILKPIGVGAAILLIVWVANILRPELTGRSALAGAGLFIIYVATARSPGFWDQRGGVVSVTDLREILGDRAVQVLYALIGIALIALSIFGEW